MAVTEIPSTKTRKWRGIYRGEFFGNILSAFNIDLERNEGTIHLSEQLQEILTSDDDAQLELPISFLKGNADSTIRYWARCGRFLFKSTDSNPESAWIQDAIANSPTNLDNGKGNLLEYKDNMHIPNGTNIARLVSGTWTANWWTATAGGASLTSAVAHILALSPLGDMIISNGNKLHYWDGSTVKTITLPTQYEITDMLTIGTITIISVKTLDGTEALCFHWNGIDTTITEKFHTGTNNVVRIFTDGADPYIITERGQIRKFNGIEYEELRVSRDSTIGFPLSKTGTIRIGGVGPLDGKVGIVVGGSIVDPTEFHGIWIFDSVNLNLYPKYALTMAPTVSNEFGGHSRYDTPGGYLETTPGSGKFLVGGRLYVNSSTQKYVICTSKEEATATHRGYFITPKIPTSAMREFWKDINLLFQKLEDSADRVLIKYKIADSSTVPLVKSITWVDTTSFTVVSATGLSEGDEVFVLRGPFPSFSAHITDITGNTITIDTATPASSTAVGSALFDNWTDLGTISDQTIQKKLFSLIKVSTFVQFKVEMRGNELSPEFHQLVLEHTPKVV